MTHASVINSSDTSDCRIGDAGVQALIGVLSTVSVLAELDLRGMHTHHMVVFYDHVELQVTTCRTMA